MTLIGFDRNKYLTLFKTQGASAALTCLQTDTVAWEYEAFEGGNGYDPELWRQLEDVRKFSRELWDLATR